MPAGYDYMHQGQMYALKHVVIPKLKAAAPPVVAVLVLLVGVLMWRRRRRKQGV
jgi:arylsulfatase/uncharacterized sulfatase